MIIQENEPDLFNVTCCINATSKTKYALLCACTCTSVSNAVYRNQHE